ncbi:MFS transporter [Paracoccaceae bacterium]
MPVAIASLVLGYVLSQFYRAFLAVLTPVLAADLGTTPESLASASGWWFLAFAVMQLPVGWALDRIGPRRTASGLLLVAAAGAALFAMATGPGAVIWAMALIGAGCSAILMAGYYIFARQFSAAVFGTLAAVMVGVGSLGNLAASLPLSAAVAAIGWRGTLWSLASVTAVVALAIFALVRDPARVEGGARGSVLDLLKMPALWPVLIMMAAAYPPAAGLRGLWAGPWQADVFGADAAAIGQVTLIMGLAMVVGTFAYGPLERVLGTRKWLNFAGNALALACLVGLMLRVDQPGWLTVGLLAGVGFYGSSFPMLMGYGPAFLPPLVIGRGVTLINLFGIGAAGVMQLVTGRVYAAAAPEPVQGPYAAVFMTYVVLVAVGLVVYLFSRDRTD